MKILKKLIALLVLVISSSFAYADTYNTANNQLTIPLITLGSTTYTNVVVTVGSLVSVNTGTPGATDLYTPATNVLAIPSITVSGTTYTNVMITVGSVVSVNVPGIQMGGARQGSLLNLAGTVSTFVGPNNTACAANGGSCPIGSIDGLGTAARLRGPWGITTDGSSLFVADNNGNTIRKVLIATGQTSTLAGTANVIGGFLDGAGAKAQFNLPTGITTDGTSIFVADSGNNNIRKVVISTGLVTTIAGPDNSTCLASFSICPSGTTDGFGAAARFNKPSGITTDGINLYVADMGNNTIRKIVISTGQVTTFAGAVGLAFGGFADGIGAAATFFKPYGLVTDGSNLYVADTGNFTIRKVEIAIQQVTTIAGMAGIFGSVDGVGMAARFNNPSYITTDGTNLFVADNANFTIRKLVILTGQVSTLAGMARVSGFADGATLAARFSGQFGFGITTDGRSLYVTDTTNNTIRNIQ